MFCQAGLGKCDWTPVVDKKVGFVSIAVEHMICCAGQGDIQHQHPGIGSDYEAQSPRGISVLYVATCGPASLQESALMPQG